MRWAKAGRQTPCALRIGSILRMGNVPRITALGNLMLGLDWRYYEKLLIKVYQDDGHPLENVQRGDPDLHPCSWIHDEDGTPRWAIPRGRSPHPQLLRDLRECGVNLLRLHVSESVCNPDRRRSSTAGGP